MRCQKRASASGDNLSLQVEFGRLYYYGGQEQFYAVCSTHGAGCRMTRTKNADKRLLRRAQGRPLGLLSAWLRDGAAYPSAWHHMKLCMPSLEARQYGRARLHLVEGAGKFLALDRARREDEYSDPEDLP